MRQARPIQTRWRCGGASDGYEEQNIKLGNWVTTQRRDHTLHLEGKPSPITLARIQELESLGFEWKPSISRRKGPPKKPSLDDDDDATYVRERTGEAPKRALIHISEPTRPYESSYAVFCLKKKKKQKKNDIISTYLTNKIITTAA